MLDNLSAYVRKRKEVRADRAGIKAHHAMITALGGNAKGSIDSSIASYDNSTGQPMETSHGMVHGVQSIEPKGK
jgi:hypothetical protein